MSPRAHAQLMLGIRTFYEQEQHFAIPYKFRVPVSAPATPSAPAVTSTWPKELQGMPLGIKVHKFIQSVAKGNPKQSTKQLNDLQQLGFPWARWKQYLLNEVCLPALETFQALEGHLFVPQKFVVEYGDARWPRSTWGYQLGVQVATLRKQRDTLPQEEVRALDALGFIWNVRDAKWDQYFMPGLRRFHELFDHADVPLAFVIPDKDHEDSAKWPPALHGYMLGRHVYMVRSGNYASQAQSSEQELERLGFSFSLSEKAWTQSILPALQTFAQLYHHCDVQQDFVVPSEAPWPEKAWGSRLGHTVKSIRQGAYAAQVVTSQEELDRLQFVWSAKHRVDLTVRHIVVPAMTAYEKLHGHVQISTDFEVPTSDPLWPEQCRGFKLGYWIIRARAGQIDLSATHRELLEDVGFVWRFTDARWNDVLLPAFRVYAQVHGSCEGMSTKFLVPHELPYPERSWGANLGGAMWHMRNGDTYVHDQQKQQELRQLGVL